MADARICTFQQDGSRECCLLGKFCPVVGHVDLEEPNKNPIEFLEQE